MRIITVSEEELQILIGNAIAPLVEKVASLSDKVQAFVNNEPRINRAEVARMLGITHKQVVSISYPLGTKPPKSKQRLPYELVGNRYLYNIEDVLAYKKATG